MNVLNDRRLVCIHLSRELYAINNIRHFPKRPAHIVLVMRKYLSFKLIIAFISVVFFFVYILKFENNCVFRFVAASYGEQLIGNNCGVILGKEG